MPCKPLPLNLDRAIVPVSIEPRFTDGYDTTIAGHGGNTLPIGFGRVFTIVGVYPNRRPDIVMLLSQLQTGLAAFDAGPDGSHADEVRRPSILKDLIEIVRKLVAGQVSVSIKERHRDVFDQFLALPPTNRRVRRVGKKSVTRVKRLAQGTKVSEVWSNIASKRSPENPLKPNLEQDSDSGGSRKLRNVPGLTNQRKVGQSPTAAGLIRFVPVHHFGITQTPA